MAKGKQALHAARRREREAQEAEKAARTELSEARAEIAQLKRQLGSQEVAEAEAAQLREQVAAGTSDKLEALEEKYFSLLQEAVDARHFLKTVKKLHDNMVTAALIRLGGGMEAMADFVALVDPSKGVNRTIVTGYFSRGSVPAEAMRIIERRRSRGRGNVQNLKVRRETLLRLAEECPEHAEMLTHMAESK